MVYMIQVLLTSFISDLAEILCQNYPHALCFFSLVYLYSAAPYL